MISKRTALIEAAAGCLLLCFMLGACSFFHPSTTPAATGQPEPAVTPVPSTTSTTTKPSSSTGKIISMKGVGIDIPLADFFAMKAAGIEVLTTEWGMEESISNTRTFLDYAKTAGLKVILDGGFSYTAWGFTDDDWDSLPSGKKPSWRKERVQAWVKTFKDHPAVYGWDICNEYGENLPSGSGAENSGWPKTAITLEQLKQVRADVLAIDPDKPIMIRTYSWDDESEPPFGYHRPFVQGLAEIVSLNLYSNYLENGRIQWPTVIEDKAAVYTNIIKKTDPDAKVWLAIGAFEDLPSFGKPTAASLTRDISGALKIKAVDGLSFFCWGPSYPSEVGGKQWYLPQTGSELWDVIKRCIK